MDVEVRVQDEEDVVWADKRQGASLFGGSALSKGCLRREMKEAFVFGETEG